MSCGLIATAKLSHQGTHGRSPRDEVEGDLQAVVDGPVRQGPDVLEEFDISWLVLRVKELPDVDVDTLQCLRRGQ